MPQAILRIRAAGRRPMAVLAGLVVVAIGVATGFWLSFDGPQPRRSVCLPGTPLPDLTLPRLWMAPVEEPGKTNSAGPKPIVPPGALPTVRLASFRGHKVVCLFMSSYT